MVGVSSNSSAFRAWKGRMTLVSFRRPCAPPKRGAVFIPQERKHRREPNRTISCCICNTKLSDRVGWFRDREPTTFHAHCRASENRIPVWPLLRQFKEWMDEPMTDRELLRDYAEHGSERAFQSLVQRHVDLVFATAIRRLGE